MTFEPSLARKGLDRLLATYPPFDVLDVHWQGQREWATGDDAGPWLLVDLGQASEGDVEAFARHRFAIWKATGAVYGVGHDGAVFDDPILEVA